MTLSDENQYYDSWKKESEQFQQNGIYRSLSDLIPLGNVLEFGCGNGNSTFILSEKRRVLALEKNKLLINEAKKKLAIRGGNVEIYEIDFFRISNKLIYKIAEFQPEIIVGWFIGSNGKDIYKYTQEESNQLNKAKLYREKIEDIIVSKNVCIDSVNTIQLVNRGAMVAGFSPEEIFHSVKDDYDKYVFNQVGFEVINVKVFDWNNEGSSFGYIKAENPNLADDEQKPSITSIIAKRKL